jgi:predicted amidophosphoribosyltransferase
MENGKWKKICIRCNKNTEHLARWCNNCYNEYKKQEAFYRVKAYNLLKKKSLDTNCEITGCNKQMLKYYFETLFDNNMN